MARGRRKCPVGSKLVCVPKGMVLVERAHLQEDMREARTSIKELQRGIKRDAAALKGK